MIFRNLDIGKLSVIGLSTNIEFFLHKYIGSTEQKKRFLYNNNARFKLN